MYRFTVFERKRIDNRTVSSVSVNTRFRNPIANSIMTLNEMFLRYPNAIPLGSGRPEKEFCNVVHQADKYIQTTVEYLRKNRSVPVEQILGQYGPSSGIINDIVARHLEVDENIKVNPEDIIITLGFQEAAELCTKVLFLEKDVLLLPDPTYIGLSGSALMNNVTMKAMPWDGSKFNKWVFENTLDEIRSKGQTPKAIYVIPSYNNPQGMTLPLEDRWHLINWSEKNDVLIIEDNPYGVFNYSGLPNLPSLKSLAPNQVIHLGSASKTLFPALRIGYVVLGQEALLGDERTKLSRIFAQAKTFTTVNTPTLDQAFFAGVLLENNYSLKPFCKPQIEFNKNNLRTILKSLQEKFSGNGWNVSWNVPEGGYFITVSLPFEFGLSEMEECAEKFNLLVAPLSMFLLFNQPNNQIRLSFTNVKSEQISQGIENLFNYVSYKLECQNTLRLN